VIPQPNQHIKCIFRNGTIIEGIVRVWEKDEAVLISIHDDSLMVILHPMEDVMLLKILPENESQKAEQSPIQEQIRQKLQEVAQPSQEPALQQHTISQLRKLSQEQDRQMIANKIREHFPKSQLSRTAYHSQAGLLSKRNGHGQS
jgi:hypothetical protein